MLLLFYHAFSFQEKILETGLNASVFNLVKKAAKEGFMKHIYLVFTLIAVFTLVGCSSNDKQKEVLDYSDKIQDYNTEISFISDEFKKGFVDENNYTKATEFLHKHSIPDYEKVKNKVDKFQTDNEEISNIHKDYKKIIDFEFGIYKKYLLAMNTEDQEMFSSINKDVDELHRKTENFHKKLSLLAKKYKIELEFKE